MFISIVVATWLFHAWIVVAKMLEAEGCDKPSSLILSGIYIAVPSLALWYHGLWSL